MRLDLFLRTTHLLKRRELAKELCDEGMVRINGLPRKASAEVSVGDELDFPIYNRLLKVRVLDVPQGNLPKGSQWSFIEILEDKRFPAEEYFGGDPLAPPQKSPTFH
ncbi:MAG: S4 domain-containing protein [Holophagaceae bacterium]|nr:S4 domain-containing protein [Holophagaceae bacterium]